MLSQKERENRNSYVYWFSLCNHENKTVNIQINSDFCFITVLDHL